MRSFPLIVLLLSTAVPAGALAQISAPDTIVMDPAIRVGTLPNGLRYYVRANKQPKNRAELRLVVHAGSLQEDDDQRGLAHFVEHMAFNGTKSFPKNKLVNYLESIGMRFGADLNASTTFGSTTYRLEVPSDSGGHLETGFQMLEDWAHNITFDSVEIEAERPVILAERRRSLGVSQRLQDEQIPVLFRGSRYADRRPIGTPEVIATAGRDKLVRFYRDWYRPDLMAVVAVGDFDPAVVERIIRDKFTRIPRSAARRPRETYRVPLGSGTVVAVIADPELTRTNATLLFKGVPKPSNKTVEGYRASLVRGIYASMLGQRLGETARKPDAPFLGASSGFGELGEDVGVYQLSVSVANNGIPRGIRAALAEATRVAQQGFTQPELDRARQGYLRGLEHAQTDSAQIRSSAFAQALVGHFLNGAPVATLDTRIAMGRRIAPGITLADVNAEARSATAVASRIIIVTIPENAGIVKPTEAELLALFDTTGMKPIERYTEAAMTSSLLEKLPQPGRVVSAEYDSASGVTIWKLSNGARVLLKPTDFRADQILFAGHSPGGYNVATDPDFLNARFAGNLMGVGGYGALPLTELRRALTGKLVAVTTGLSGRAETVSGNASPKDIDTMFQLLTLMFTSPRYDSAAVATQIDRMKAQLANRDASPATAFADTVNRTMAQQHPRAPIVTASLLDSVEPARAYELYRQRFANASDFTFLLVGSFSLDSIRPLVEQYLASLPGTGKTDVAVDPIRPPPGVVHKVVRAGREAQARTLLVFHGSFPKEYPYHVELHALEQLLQLRLTERIREQLAGTYSVQVGREVVLEPRSEYSVKISFVAAPDRLNELVAAVLAEIEKIKGEGPTSEELGKVTESAVRSLETNRRRNELWINLLTYDRNDWPLADIANDAAWTALTRKRVADAAKRYLDTSRYARFDLVPEFAPVK